MPSSMIHLALGMEIDPHAPTIFYIGCLAPDCIEERAFKDRHHFRNCSDRELSLNMFGKSLDLSDPFQYAVLLHLYADMKWDESTSTEFRKDFYKDNIFAFREYRKEIGIIGNHLYHTMPWAPSLWKDMSAFPVEKIPNIHDFPPEEIHTFITRQGRWHAENTTGPSAIFTDKFIKRFLHETTKGYWSWLQKRVLK